MPPDVQSIVIGAGVVGLACAAALADSGREVLVLERNDAIGEETSARNSEVIHAGIYYPPGSAKARLCVDGKARLYAFCAARGVPAARIGKLIVATRAEDVATLSVLVERGAANGVNDLELLDRAAAVALETALSCHAALLSPSTGIVDSHQLMLALQGDLESLGGVVSTQSKVRAMTAESDGILLTVDTGEGEMTLRAREVVNCAGHEAVALARALTGAPCQDLPEAFYARGNYFRLSGAAPFARLIYPVPEPGGLGIHLTLDLAGNARFGPDVEPVEGPAAGYAVDPSRAERFTDSIRQYWPELPENALQPDYAGIRPKIRRPGVEVADFEIQGPVRHGVSGLVHCLGIESPGLTSCLAIADAVVRLLGESA